MTKTELPTLVNKVNEGEDTAPGVSIPKSMNLSYMNFRIYSNTESAVAFVSNDERQVT